MRAHSIWPFWRHVILGILVLEAVLMGSDAGAEKRFKGTEVWPWKLKGKLVFTVLPGTNRLKSCSEVRSIKAALDLAGLEKTLSSLDQGEYVFVMGGGQMKGCELATVPREIEIKLKKFAHTRKLSLHFMN